MNIYHTDDEFRTQGDGLIGKPVITGQETVQGASTSIRLDLLKKHLSADPVAMRQLYAIITHMYELVGLKRFEMNRFPKFEGVDELVFNNRSIGASSQKGFFTHTGLTQSDNGQSQHCRPLLVH